MFRFRLRNTRDVTARVRLMCRNRSISASLHARRALLLAEGRRRFYVFPLDVGPHSRLGKIPHASMSDCIASAHAWLQRARSEDAWWFSVVERAELNGESTWASVQDILVYNDLLPVSEAKGARFGSPREARGEPGAAERTPGAGTFKATNGKGVPCRRRRVPQYG